MGNESASALMTAEFKQLNELCLLLEKQITQDQGKGNQNEKLILQKEGFLAMRIAMLYYAEANRCVQAEAWFAATTVGAAALEALLLAKCLFDADSVRSLSKFKSLKGKATRDFSHFVRQLDLGKLLEVADSLNWLEASEFPGLLRGYMAPYFGPEAMQAIIRPFEMTSNVGRLYAERLHENRNLIHPSVCLKKGELPTPETGMAGTFFLLALLAIMISKN